MKHTFTGNLVLQVEDEKIPLTCIEYNEIATASEYETLVLKGVGLLYKCQKLKHSIVSDSFNTLQDASFCGSIFDGDELVMEVFNTIVVSGTSGILDEVEIQSEFWKFGHGKVATEMSQIHQKNTETWQRTQPDYSECDD